MYIHFSNLDRRVSQADIYSLLKVFAPVGYCVIHHVKHVDTGGLRTYAMVDMPNLTEIEQAVKELDGTMLGGRNIVVQVGG